MHPSHTFVQAPKSFASLLAHASRAACIRAGRGSADLLQLWQSATFPLLFLSAQELQSLQTCCTGDL